MSICNKNTHKRAVLAFLIICLLFSYTTYAEGSDILANILNSIIGGNTNNSQKTSKTYNNANHIVYHPFLKSKKTMHYAAMRNGPTKTVRHSLAKFPINGNTVVKNAAISGDGTRLARIIKSGNQERLIVQFSQGAERTFFQTNHSVENVVFCGINFIVCVIADKNHHQFLKLLNLERGTYYDLKPIAKATYISLIPSKTNEGLRAICYDGRKYYTYLIDVKNNRCNRLIESNIPPIFDKNLQARVYYQLATSALGTAKGFDVFAIPKSEGKKSSTHLKIDRIKDISKEIYVSVVDNLCYKLSLASEDLQKEEKEEEEEDGEDEEEEQKEESENALVISGIDISDGSAIDLGAVEGVTKLSDCRVNLDSKGKPIFITVGSGDQMQNFPLEEDLQEKLEAISEQFDGIGWYRVNYTADNSMWILCVCTKPNRYFLYDTKTGKIAEISVTKKNTLLKGKGADKTLPSNLPNGVQVL